MTDKKDKQTSKEQKPKPKPSEYIEERGKMGWDPKRKEDVHKVLDTLPPPDKPPKK